MHVGDYEVENSINAVRNTGVHMDHHTFMETHIRKVCKLTYYHLCNTGKLKKYLNRTPLNQVIHVWCRGILEAVFCACALSLGWLACYSLPHLLIRFCVKGPRSGGRQFVCLGDNHICLVNDHPGLLLNVVWVRFPSTLGQGLLSLLTAPHR